MIYTGLMCEVGFQKASLFFAGTVSAVFFLADEQKIKRSAVRLAGADKRLFESLLR